MMPSKLHKISLALPLTIATTAGAVAVSAQELALEEIIVSAQKRAESLQTVPVAVTAISGEKIAEAAILDIQDLTNYVPNVVMFNSPGGGSPASIFIRGIGSGNNSAFEQSVGTFVDGIYAGRTRQFLVPFMDLQAVEVLKGPQGVLFGKNTVAGAMIVNSARPTADFEGEVRALYEAEYGSQEYTAIVSGPLGERVSGRLAGKLQKFNGYMDNLVRGTEEPEVENTAIRGSLSWDPTDSISVYTKLEYAEQETIGNNTQLTSIAGNFRGLINHADVITPIETAQFDDKNTLNSWNEEGTQTESLNGLVQIDWELDNLTLTSLTGYSDYQADFVLDGDSSDYLFIEQGQYEDFEQISQEFRLTSRAGGPIDYILGVYLESQELTVDTPTDISLVALSAINVPGSPVPPFELGQNPTYQQDAETAAAFGEVTWHMADDWSLTGGLRYAYDKKDGNLITRTTDIFEREQTTNPVLIGVARGLLNRTDAEIDEERSTGNLSYSLNLSWQYDDHGLAYLRNTRGFKSGGFNPNVPDGDPNKFEYDDEEVNSIELGAKMMLLDGAATLNLAAFYTELTNLQVSSFVDSGFIVGNAAESTSQGVEIEARWQAAPFLDFTVSGAYLDSVYDDFPGAPCTADQLAADDPVASGCEGWVAANPTAGTTNLAGQTAGRAPQWTGTLITNLTLPVGDAMLFRGTVDVMFEDELNTPADPNYQDSYVRVNARLALASTLDTWTVALVGKNLTDETLFGNGFGVGFFSGSWAKNRQPPRTVALDLSYRF